LKYLITWQEQRAKGIDAQALLAQRMNMTLKDLGHVTQDNCYVLAYNYSARAILLREIGYEEPEPVKDDGDYRQNFRPTGQRRNLTF